MTSTNDGKDLKTNQTSVPKGKTYFIELYKFLEERLSEGCDAGERSGHLCEAWRRVHSLCQHSAPSTHAHLLGWLQRHTARAVLQTEWQTPKRKDDRASLEEAIDCFVAHCEAAKASRNGISAPWEVQLVARGEWFKRVLEHPWDHPVLTLLLNPNGTPPTDDDVLEWLKEERGVTFVMRLYTLVGEKCDDIAVSLATAVMERARAAMPPVSDAEEPIDKPPPENAELTFGDKLTQEAGFSTDVWETLTDIEFVLLHKRDSKRCIALAKLTPLPSAYHLIERLQKRLEISPREKRLWKNAKEVAVLIAQVVIARCMMVGACAGAVRSALYCCARLLARLAPAPRLAPAADALANQAPTARHLHTLAAAIDKQLSPTNEDMKPYICELYVRAITAGMNELERLKLKTEKEAEARSMEKTLASWFVQLGDVLARSDRVLCECTLTAFSLHPSPNMYQLLDAAPQPAPHTKDSDESKEETVKSEFGSWANDSRSQTNFVKTSETLKLKQSQNQANVLSTAIFNEGEALGLNPELCQDIAVLLSGPRIKTLSWDMDRSLLLEHCRAYMKRTQGGTRVPTRELKFLNIDPAHYRHLPEDRDDDENDPHYGIERGYEHLVPEEIWEDAEDLDRTETASSCVEDDYVAPRRKKKNKRTPLSSDEDSDPLSFMAEAKRVQKKKERPHSKERSKERAKKKQEPVDPLDIGESPNQKKDKPKEKKERKKKEKSTKAKPDKSLANLVGLKVVKNKKKSIKDATIMVTTKSLVTDSSHGKDLLALNSQGNKHNVVVPCGGLLSTGQPKSIQRKNTPFLNRMEIMKKELGIASGSVEVKNPHQHLERTPNSFNRMAYRPPTPNTVQRQSPANHSRNSSPKTRTVPDDIRESITKLLDYRRKAAMELNDKLQNDTAQSPQRKLAIIRPNTPIQTNVSPKAVAIPEIPKSYIKKQHSEKLAKLKREVDNLLAQRNRIAQAAIPSPVIQFAKKSNVNKMVTNKPHTGNQQSNAHSLKMSDSANVSYDRLMAEIAERQDLHRSNYDVVKPLHTQYQPTQSTTLQRSLNAVTPGQRDYQNFLKEYDKNKFSTNVCALDMSSKKPSKDSRKDNRPDSRLSQVVPSENTKTEPKTPQIAKQSHQKKPEISLNTFSRLSYMHKNKQTEMKDKNSPQQPMFSSTTYHEVSSELDEIIKEHQRAQMRVIQAKNDRFDRLLERKTNNNTQKCIQNAVGLQSRVHPLLSNLLQSPSSCSTKQIQKPVLPPKTSLSEKDQNELLHLLRQQNKLNAPLHHTTNINSKPSTSSTSYDVSNVTSPVTNSASYQKEPIKSDSYQSTFETKIINIISNTLLKQAHNAEKCGNNKSKSPILATKSIKATDSQEKDKKLAVIKDHTKKNSIKCIPESETPEWQAVMSDLLKHKTPSRGPNALDVALNKSSYELAFEKSLQESANIFAPLQATNKNSERFNSVKQHRKSYPPKLETTSAHDVTIFSNKGLKIQAASPKQPVVLSGQKEYLIKTDSSNNEKLAKHPPKRLSQEAQRKQFIYAGPKHDDPFISGIPNSDYDLLEELMDDDLRKEIGELSSDDENYNATAQSFLKPNKGNEKRVSVEYNKPLNDTAPNKPVVVTQCLNTHQPANEMTQPVVQKHVNKTVQRSNNIKLSKKAADNKTQDITCLVTSTTQTISPHIPATQKRENQPCNNLKILTNNQVAIDPNIYISAVPQQAPIQNVVLIGPQLVYEGYSSVQSPVHCNNNIASSSYVNNTPNITLYQTTQFAASVASSLIIENSMTIPIINNVPCAAISLQPNVLPTYSTSSVEPQTQPEPYKGIEKCNFNAEINNPMSETDCPLQDSKNLDPDKTCGRKVLSEVQELVVTEKTDKAWTKNIEYNMKDASVDQERLKNKRLAIINREIYHRCGDTPIPLAYAPLHQRAEIVSKQHSYTLLHSMEDKQKLPDNEENKLKGISDAINKIENRASPNSNESKENNSFSIVNCRRILLRSSNKITSKAKADTVESETTTSKKSKVKLKPDIPESTEKIVDTSSQNNADVKVTAQKRTSKRLHNRTLTITKDDEKTPSNNQLHSKQNPRAKVLPKNKFSKLKDKTEKSNLTRVVNDMKFFDIEAELLSSKISTKVSNIEEKEKVTDILTAREVKDITSVVSSSQKTENISQQIGDKKNYKVAVDVAVDSVNVILNNKILNAKNGKPDNVEDRTNKTINEVAKEITEKLVSGELNVNLTYEKDKSIKDININEITEKMYEKTIGELNENVTPHSEKSKLLTDLKLILVSETTSEVLSSEGIIKKPKAKVDTSEITANITTAFNAQNTSGVPAITTDINDQNISEIITNITKEFDDQNISELTKNTTAVNDQNTSEITVITNAVSDQNMSEIMSNITTATNVQNTSEIITITTAVTDQNLSEIITNITAAVNVQNTSELASNSTTKEVNDQNISERITNITTAVSDQNTPEITTKITTAVNDQNTSEIAMNDDASAVNDENTPELSTTTEVNDQNTPEITTNIRTAANDQNMSEIAMDITSAVDDQNTPELAANSTTTAVDAQNTSEETANITTKVNYQNTDDLSEKENIDLDMTVTCEEVRVSKMTSAVTIISARSKLKNNDVIISEVIKHNKAPISSDIQSTDVAKNFDYGDIECVQKSRDTLSKDRETKLNQLNEKYSDSSLITNTTTGNMDDDVVLIDDDSNLAPEIPDPKHGNFASQKKANTDGTGNTYINELSKIPESYKDSIAIVHLPSDDPLKKSACVTNPNGNKFKATVYGDVHVNLDTLFAYPTIRSDIFTRLSTGKSYTLNAKQITMMAKSDPNLIISAKNQDVKRKEEEPLETIDLLSDDDDYDPSQITKTETRTFETEYGKYKISSIDNDTFSEHQNKFSQKTKIFLNKCDLEPNIHTQMKNNARVAQMNTLPLVPEKYITGLINDIKNKVNSQIIQTEIPDIIEIDDSSNDSLDHSKLIENIQPDEKINELKNVLLKELGVKRKTPTTENILHEDINEGNKSCVVKEIDSITSDSPSPASEIPKLSVVPIDVYPIDVLEKEEQLKIVNKKCFIKLVRCDDLVRMFENEHLDSMETLSAEVLYDEPITITEDFSILDDLDANIVDSEARSSSSVIELSDVLVSLDNTAVKHADVIAALDNNTVTQKESALHEAISLSCEAIWLSTKPTLHLLSVDKSVLLKHKISDHNNKKNNCDYTSYVCKGDWFITKPMLQLQSFDNIELAQSKSSSGQNDEKDSSEAFMPCVCEANWFTNKPTLHLQRLDNDLFVQLNISNHKKVINIETTTPCSINETSNKTVLLQTNCAPSLTSLVLKNIQDTTHIIYRHRPFCDDITHSAFKSLKRKSPLLETPSASKVSKLGDEIIATNLSDCSLASTVTLDSYDSDIKNDSASNVEDTFDLEISLSDKFIHSAKSLNETEHELIVEAARVACEDNYNFNVRNKDEEHFFEICSFKSQNNRTENTIDSSDASIRVDYKMEIENVTKDIANSNEKHATSQNVETKIMSEEIEKIDKNTSREPRFSSLAIDLAHNMPTLYGTKSINHTPMPSPKMEIGNTSSACDNNCHISSPIVNMKKLLQENILTDIDYNNISKAMSLETECEKELQTKGISYAINPCVKMTPGNETDNSSLDVDVKNIRSIHGISIQSQAIEDNKRNVKNNRDGIEIRLVKIASESLMDVFNEKQIQQNYQMVQAFVARNEDEEIDDKKKDPITSIKTILDQECLTNEEQKMEYLNYGKGHDRDILFEESPSENGTIIVDHEFITSVTGISMSDCINETSDEELQEVYVIRPDGVFLSEDDPTKKLEEEVIQMRPYETKDSVENSDMSIKNIDYEEKATTISPYVEMNTATTTDNDCSGQVGAYDNTTDKLDVVVLEKYKKHKPFKDSVELYEVSIKNNVNSQNTAVTSIDVRSQSEATVDGHFTHDEVFLSEVDPTKELEDEVIQMRPYETINHIPFYQVRNKIENYEMETSHLTYYDKVTTTINADCSNQEADDNLEVLEKYPKNEDSVENSDMSIKKIGYEENTTIFSPDIETETESTIDNDCSGQVVAYCNTTDKLDVEVLEQYCKRHKPSKDPVEECEVSIQHIGNAQKITITSTDVRSESSHMDEFDNQTDNLDVDIIEKYNQKKELSKDYIDECEVSIKNIGYEQKGSSSEVVGYDNKTDKLDFDVLEKYYEEREPSKDSVDECEVSIKNISNKWTAATSTDVRARSEMTLDGVCSSQMDELDNETDNLYVDIIGKDNKKEPPKDYAEECEVSIKNISYEQKGWVTSTEVKAEIETTISNGCSSEVVGYDNKTDKLDVDVTEKYYKKQESSNESVDECEVSVKNIGNEQKATVTFTDVKAESETTVDGDCSSQMDEIDNQTDNLGVDIIEKYNKKEGPPKDYAEECQVSIKNNEQKGWVTSTKVKAEIETTINNDCSSEDVGYDNKTDKLDVDVTEKYYKKQESSKDSVYECEVSVKNICNEQKGTVTSTDVKAESETSVNGDCSSLMDEFDNQTDNVDVYIIEKANKKEEPSKDYLEECELSIKNVDYEQKGSATSTEVRAETATTIDYDYCRQVFENQTNHLDVDVLVNYSENEEFTKDSVQKCVGSIKIGIKEKPIITTSDVNSDTIVSKYLTLIGNGSDVLEGIIEYDNPTRRTCYVVPIIDKSLNTEEEVISRVIQDLSGNKTEKVKDVIINIGSAHELSQSSLSMKVNKDHVIEFCDDIEVRLAKIVGEPVMDVDVVEHTQNKSLEKQNIEHKVADTEVIFDGIYNYSVEVEAIFQSEPNSQEDHIIHKSHKIYKSDNESLVEGDDKECSSRVNNEASTENLKVIVPKHTYERGSEHTRQRWKNLKRKMDMCDVKIQEKKYRKGKNIDYPKNRASAITETAYSKEYKRLLDYCSSVKFSYAVPFHKEDIDVHSSLKSWPIKNCDTVMLEDPTDTRETLFTEIDKSEAVSDPLEQTLSDELIGDYNKDSYKPSNIDETNFKMGFGEGSGRVIQKLKDGEFSKFSAATLSDVKLQPLLPSDEQEALLIRQNFNGNEIHDQKLKIMRFVDHMNMRERVQSFFKKTQAELTWDWKRSNKKDDCENTDELSNWPFDLTSSSCIHPPPVNIIVNVIQLGQLPVSASAQNPVTCDPRVTHVSNVSSSQCSPENCSGDDIQTAIKTEYTELTTADITLPLMQEYVHHHHSMPTESQQPTNSYSADETTEIKTVVKIELMEESSQEKLEEIVVYDNNSAHQLSNGNINNSVQYQIDNIASNITLEPDTNVKAVTISLEKPKTTKSFSEDKQHNEPLNKSDQISHAMNVGSVTAAQRISKTSSADALAEAMSQNAQPNVNTSQGNTNNLTKSTPINAIALQQALAQILPPLNQPNTSENNQQPSTNQQVLHIVQGNNAQSVINKTNGTQLLHIVQNKSGANTKGTPATQPSSFSGLSLVDGSIQQNGNQILHIVNTGNQKNSNAGQLLKRVNLLTSLANVQGSNEQKMVQFVCKSADGKTIQLPQQQRGMVLRLHPLEPSSVPTTPKQNEAQDSSPSLSSSTSQSVNEKEATPQEMKSRSLYEENYAKFVQNGDSKPVQEKATSLPKFNQVFGKQGYQDKQNEIDDENLPENTECPPKDNNEQLEQINDIDSPPMLARNPTQPPNVPPNLVQQIKQTIGPMNIQTMHGGVIYTRQIPVNIGGGQTINLITVPSTEMVDETAQKQPTDAKFANQEGEPPIIKIVPTNPATNSNGPTEDNSAQMGSSNETNAQTNPQPQPQPVLTQMRIKLPMLSKAPQMVGGTRVVRPSFFQIQRNVIGGANQQVYQQLVLTAAPPLGQSVRVPAPTQKPKTPTETQSSPESQMSSSTLEQLREFDMVLEQVKERSTVNPGSSSSNKFTKLNTSADTTDSSPPSTSTQVSPTQVLYSVGNTQPLNMVSYVNRKSTITSTASSYERSPDSTAAIESPSSSTHAHLPQSVSEPCASSSSCASEAAATTIQPKPKKKKPKPSTSNSNPFNIKNTPKPSSQKPLEDEQTTQRILYILAEYKEQVENSPDKDKPAPRRRNNPAAPGAGSSKRKKSSSGSRKRDMSPVQGEDSCRTMGSEDSSCGTSMGECNECLETQSPEESPRKVVRKLTFEQETHVTQTHTIPQRNVIVTDGQAFAVRGAAGKPAATVLMPANYLLPVSMVKGGQQIAIVTNRGPKLLVGAAEGGAGGTLLFQRLIGPAGLKPMLTRPGVRHIRLPTAALHNLQAFNIATPAAAAQPPDSTASPAPAPAPPDLVDSRATSSPWQDRDGGKPDRGNSSPEGSEPWNLPSSSIADDYGYEEIVRTDNMDRTVLDAIPDRYSPDMEAQRIFDKMFDVDSKKSMYDSRCGYDIDASDDDKAYHQVVQRKDGRHTRLTHVSAAALRHKCAILEQELRLQKSLSEECEDLGVDSPSASDLFPEAELLFAPSPAHEQTVDPCHAPQSTILSQGIPQPDLDDQIATDHLLTNDRHDELDINLDDVGEIVTVGEDGMTTIPLDHEEFARSHEEFARSHPNTTFHSEPEDGQITPFTIAQGIKGRQITFHARGAPGTVVMAPQTTVISQATVEATGSQHTVKFTDIDNMLNAMPSPQRPQNINNSALVKDNSEGFSKFDRFLNDSRELHTSNTASAIVHSTGNGTQVIRRLHYETRRDSRHMSDDPDALTSERLNDRRNTTMDNETSSPERHPELFWDTTPSRPERRRFDFSSDSDKCSKSSYDEPNSESVGIGAHTRLDSVIKAARTERRRSDGSADDSHPPLRTYPPKRPHHHASPHSEGERSSAKARISERCHDGKDESRRRASNRGVVKRGCHCCNGSTPPKQKKSRPKKSNDFPTHN